MSMHRDVKMATNIDEDESWLEAEVQRELDALNTGDLDDENDSDDKENVIQDSSSDQDETKEKVRMSEMDAYIHKMQAQTARLEQELEECDELMQHTDLIVSTPRPDQDDLVILAEARGMDAETLKRKVLEELDRVDVEDERLLLESVNDDWDQPQEPQDALTTITTDTKSPACVSDNGDAQPTSDTQGTFLTGVGEQNMSEEEEYRQLKRNFLGPDPKEVEEEKVAEDKVEEEDNEEDENEEDNSPGKLTLKPGEGTLMSMVDSEALERRVMREVLDWEVKWMKTNDVKQQELTALINEDREKLEEARRQWEERQRGIEEEQKVLHQQQQAQDEKLRKEAEVLQGQIEQSIEQYETEITALTESVRMESEALLQVKAEGQKQDEEKRERAALKIQATYRGYRVYKEEGRQLKAHLEDWRQQKTEARIKALDESRKKKEEDKRKKEEAEKRRIEAEEKRKEEERQRKEEEKIRKEEERKRKEEEKRIKAEEAKRKKEEEEQRKLEEKRLKEEEKRKKKEAEQKKKEEEEDRKRKEEEKRQQEENLRLEKLQQEQEAKRLLEEKEAEAKRKREEEQRKAKEEEERQRQEAEAAVKKAEEEKLKQLGIGTPRSPVPPDGRPKTPRKKINDLRRSAMSPLANGVKSPPSSAGSQRSSSSPSSEPVQPNSSGPLPEPPREPVSTPPHSSRLKTPRSARSDPSLTLPELIEKRRLEWMEKCRPWSKTERELKIKNKPANTRKPLRRPISAKNMTELTADQILQAAGVASLQQVTTVELHDLPGCTLKTLAGCPRLRTLRVNHCKVVTTEGLGDCKHLVYLDMQHNALETVNLRDLDKLLYLDVSHNSLTAMQGLEGCTALRYLRAVHNRMTRIGGLDGLRSLHTLDFSHNQLITTKGLGAAPTLQEVDLSHNHLPALDDLDLLGLLQVLKAAGNNIIQIPLLLNHVLLRHLVLDDNSLCSARSLSQSWLPLLRHLSMAQNSLTTLDELSTCVILQELNISNNQILDIDSMLPGLKSCRHLSYLKTDGNPTHEETDFRSRVLEVLPWLEKLDGQSAPSSNDPPAVTDFERMCGEQLIVWDKLTKQYQQVLRETSELPDLASVHVRYFTTSHNIAVEQRYAHEYGESTSSSVPDSGNLTFDLSAELSAGHVAKPHSDTSQMKNKFEIALQNVNGSNSAVVNGSQQSVSEPVGNANRDSVRSSQMGKSTIRPSPVSKGLRQPAGTRNSVQNAAATRIQALWRGYQVRRDIDFHSRLWMAATSIQALWRGYFTRKVLREMGYFVGAARDEPLHRAATIIQAGWRGHCVRKRIRYALNYARMSFDEDDLDEDLDFTEVDLSAFDFNEADLEKGWTPPETPQLPANHAVIGKPSTSSQQQAADAKAAFDAAFNTPQQPFPLVKHPPHPPQQPRQAWRNVDSPLSDVPPGGRPPLPPLSRLSDHTAADSHTTARTYRSKKEEQITEEWGFKDSRTAELMMQRAKKLKHNAARKKKISQLDPKQRLALFRKLEEATNVRPVQPPVKKVLPRKEYFQAREDEVAQKAVEKQRDQVNHHMRTYEWIHTQVGAYPPPASSRINQGLSEAGQYNSEGNLPQMDAHVIAGARPNLTVYDKKRRNGSPMLLELQSLDSVSTAGDLQRRMSSGGDPASRLPPIKVSSAPSAHIHERMSFRNPKPKPTLDSVGWGGGKKRSNRR